MRYTDEFSQLYDNLMEGYEYILRPTQKMVYEFTQQKEKLDLLELGCGTGTILQAFPKNFTLYGLDISPGMLKIAKEKVKRATFVEGDMSKFHLRKKFDVIICVFDSINHLLEFKQWENTFRLTALHLKRNGIFVFDMNTVKRHKALVQLPAYIKKERNSLAVFKILQGDNNTYIDRIQIFMNIKRGKIELFEENIKEASFSTQRVITSLQKYFHIEKMVDAFRERVTKDTGRILFACRRK